MEFRNPYHFVPVGDGPPPESVPLGELKPAQDGEAPKPRTAPHITHDRFVEHMHSGRLVCKLTIETPLICGNQQEERKGWTKLIHPFELTEGEPALPGSALRGMLSTLVEGASHSAMRVLENRQMSYRRQVSEGLSAVGMIVAKADGALHLFPLASPHLDQTSGSPLPRGDGANYAVMFPAPRPKIYFGESYTLGTEAFLREYDTNASPTGGPFYAVHPSWLVSKVKVVGNNRFSLGEMITSALPGETAHKVRRWNELSEQEQSSGRWVRGILRVLGRYAERADALPTKKHEFFLRFSEQDEKDLKIGRTALFPIDMEAVSRFNQLADERAKAENTADTNPKELLPFTPHGAVREAPTERGRPSSSWRLKGGDIVFFRPSSDGKSVAEVSLSSVWRGRVEQASPRLSPAAPLWTFLHPELKPLARGRILLTLAEQLFGAVEVRDDNAPAFALASRLRVFHGILATAPNGGAYQPAEELLSNEHRKSVGGEVLDIPLKNLASPKPPSPSLYFKMRDGKGEYISKKNLNPTSHAVQGIKLYLRREPSAYRASTEVFVHPNRLRDPEQRRAIARQHQSVERFVRPGTTFYFHLNFDNLSDLEVQTLAYVLQPTPEFRHQLGHGKPLGLGQVHIEVAGLLMVNRQHRYREDLAASRWHEFWATGNPGGEWPATLRRQLPQTFNSISDKLNDLRNGFVSWAGDNGLIPVLRALELLGKPPSSDVPVHYPQVAGISPGSAQFEQELYHWFVQNDDTSKGRRSGQFLAPLINADGQVASVLPVFDRTKQSQPPDTGYSGPLQPRRPSGAPRPSPSSSTTGGAGSQAAAPASSSPRSLEGKEVDATAGKPEKDERVPFTVSYQGKVFTDIKAYVDMSRFERVKFAKLHPEGRAFRATVVKFQHRTFLIKIPPT